VNRWPPDLRTGATAISWTILLGFLAAWPSGCRQNQRQRPERPQSQRQVPTSGAVENRPAGPPRPHTIALQWKASPSAVAGYNVYRSDKPVGPYTKLKPSLIRMTSYTDPTVQSGHTYFYLVTAVDAKGRESLFSNQAPAIVPWP
jgi:hypothetical protein